MSELLILLGRPALVPFRKQKLLATLELKLPLLSDLDARYLYLVKLTQPLSAPEKERFLRLLEGSDWSNQDSGWGELLVTPRVGTQSPWSSKATHIAQGCGFESLLALERGLLYLYQTRRALSDEELAVLKGLLHDPMTESAFTERHTLAAFFDSKPPASSAKIPFLTKGLEALNEANELLRLGFSSSELEHLSHIFCQLNRDPSDVELMTFAQVNSEHCRHKIFNGQWQNQAGKPIEHTLFEMIRHTYRASAGQGVLSAYADNGAVIDSFDSDRWGADPADKRYGYENEKVPMVIKVETHNHPTAIAPFPGAATGVGGEIRDEAAVGRGSKPKAGLAGFTLSHLEIPDAEEPWELGRGYPKWLASPLQIILAGPIGAASFNNEFGRPNLLGYFRTFEQGLVDSEGHPQVFGYHKPVMLAGGLGSIRPSHIQPELFDSGDVLIVLGGPALLIGIGGGAASSRMSGDDDEAYDFASVQRSNPEMQRLCQEVIDSCVLMAENNPIRCLHDVGAGGLSNAISELVKDGGKGGVVRLAKIPVADPQMSPLEVWCNESQERYVLAIKADRMADFKAICERERCPYAGVGELTPDNRIKLEGEGFDSYLDLPLDTLIGNWPSEVQQYLPKIAGPIKRAKLTDLPIDRAIKQVLRFPAVAAKMFLITIGDRTVSGLVARDQLVGPWQVPVADVAVTLQGYRADTGEAMALGERPQLALLDSAASARMAVAEALTNIAAADIKATSEVKLSANWMAAADHPGELAKLRDAVESIGKLLCPELGIIIPVGKDSLSMQVSWQGEGAKPLSVLAPVTLNISAFAPVSNVRNTLTPQMDSSLQAVLVLVDLAKGKQRLGASVLAQTQSVLADEALDWPDLEEPAALAGLFQLLDEYRQDIMAYHDRSDGGLIVTLAEMAFAGRCGFDLDIPSSADLISWLFNEELGAIVQLPEKQLPRFLEDAKSLKLTCRAIAHPRVDQQFILRQGKRVVLKSTRADWQKEWWQVSYQIQKIRDHPECAEAELLDIERDTPGLSAVLTFDPNEDIAAPFIQANKRPPVAILREQGVNGHSEMAAAFYAGGFQPIDVHMTDIANGRFVLDRFVGIVLCGGFSYGDVLGAGLGWAKTILFNKRLRDQFSAWFERQDRFTLGVCNGCQVLSELREIVPGIAAWPRFLPNRSGQFEARVSLVQIAKTPSIFLNQMVGSVLPVAVAHGEGRADFEGNIPKETEDLTALRYLDHHHRVTDDYPYNPNGSYAAIAGLSSPNGLVTAMMPHPERVFRTVQNSWYPKEWQEDGPWLRLFRNARSWIG